MKKFFFLLLSCISLYADKAPVTPLLEGHQELSAPWLTGPLFAPAGVTIPAGHLNIETFVYSVVNQGIYDSHWRNHSAPTFYSYLLQPVLQVGVTDWMDCQIAPGVYYNQTQGKGSWSASDIPLLIDFQLYTRGEKVTEWITGLKLVLIEIFPCGKYRDLDPNMLATDSGGKGSFQTGIGLVWGNLFYLGGSRFLSSRVSIQYLYASSVQVKNTNIYGGAPGTKGTVHPGQTFQFDIGTELTLNKHWVFALDVLGVWTSKSSFSGTTQVPNALPASVQLSIAPAIEYNWSSDIGIILGPWFSIAGRNAASFTGGVIAFNYYR